MLLKLSEPQHGPWLRQAVDAVESLLVALSEPDVPKTVDAVLTSDRWPHAKPAALRRGVGLVIALSHSERVALLDAFRSDRDFWKSIDDDTFRFAVPRLPAHVKKAAEALLRATYNVLTGNGFVAGGGKLTAMSVREGFFAENPAVAVCPACLRTTLEQSIRGKAMNDLEHFFPKSRYPALAVHYHNLVPICMACNQRLHGSRDPLSAAAPQLSHTYVPYVRSAMDELTVEFEPAVPAPVVRLKGTSPEANERLRALDRLYALDERWSQALALAHDKIRDRVMLVAKPLEAQDVERALRAEAQRLRGEITKTVDALLEAEYCEWLADHSLDSFVTDLKRET